MTKQERAQIMKVLESASSCWGFMANDYSIPIDERLAATKAHDQAQIAISTLQRSGDE